MNRREELLSFIPDDSKELVVNVVDEIIFIESKLNELKRLPFIKVNPENPMQQKATPAAKQYKELMQQYINNKKVIELIIYKDKRLQDENEQEESPLRKWANSRREKL